MLWAHDGSLKPNVSDLFLRKLPLDGRVMEASNPHLFNASHTESYFIDKIGNCWARASKGTKFGTSPKTLHGILHGTFTDLHVYSEFEQTCFSFTFSFTESSRTFTFTAFLKTQLVGATKKQILLRTTCFIMGDKGVYINRHIYIYIERERERQVNSLSNNNISCTYYLT